MKFGKEILAQQIPGWSRYYLDYKFLKKIISSLAANRPASEAAILATGVRPGDPLLSPGGTPRDDPNSLEETSDVEPEIPPLQSTIFPGGGQDDKRGPIFQAHKRAFFFKLERELEKINAFYLQKEADLRLRLRTLLSKRSAALDHSRRHVAEDGATTIVGVEWRAVEEGFNLLQKDLGKLQQFIEINATGFRKILKKWDKRSKSHTKELYLSRQVEVQPCFNRELLAELSNIVASSLLDLENLPESVLVGDDDPEAHQSALERQAESAYADFEATLSCLVAFNDEAGVRAILPEIDALLQQRPAEALPHITRILWKAIIDAPPPIADLLIRSTTFDFSFVDDISGRSCLHEASIAGEARLVSMCLEKNVHSVDLQDVYGRTALQYAAMNGRAAVCELLLSAGAQPGVKDADNCTPVVYAVMNGKLDCVRVLLDRPDVSVDPSSTSPDEYNLLSLACQYGHDAVARLLVDHGAHLLPNANGEYALHLAAREGHAGLCRILVQHDMVKDSPDKYSEWTPLFHAARNGHEECVQVLLEAGCNPNATDDTGKTPVFYAAWHGHISCVNLLLQAGSPSGPRPSATSVISVSPASDADDAMADVDGDVDAIPSLSLPPPAMPFRVYGHNYLNRSYLVQIALGRPFSQPNDTKPVQAVELHSRVSGAPYLHSGPSLKLIMTTRPDVAAAPHTVILPLQDEREVFNFQLDTLEDLALEFSLYPAYGSKLVGRAVAVPSCARLQQSTEQIVLPILDHRLQVIGQVSFELCIITPFSGVRLEIGGAVETYWKSSTVTQAASLSVNHLGRLPNAPSSLRGPSTSGTSNNLTVSSLEGEYVHIVVQVTKDMVPVVYADWRLPYDDHELFVSDVTYTVFERLAKRKGKDLSSLPPHLSSAAAWHGSVSQSLISLQDFLKILPLKHGVSIELAYATPAILGHLGFGHSHDVNAFISAVLQTVYDVSGSHLGPVSADGLQSRRKVVFSSFSPQVCVALNWKQPNYAVLFASYCGVARQATHSTGAPFVADDTEDDRRCKSVGAAVDFAKANNLLGVVLHATLLVSVPSLIRAVKETGVIMAAFGGREDLAALAVPSENGTGVDALLQDGVVHYMDHALRGIV